MLFLLSCGGETGKDKNTGISQDTFNQHPVSVKIVGIAQDGGYPQVGCTKACCTKYYNGELPAKMVASLSIHTDSGYYFIDATPSFTKQVSLNTGKIPTGIFLTHGHIGHYTGLMYLGREVMNTKAMPVYCMPRMQGFLVNNGPWSQLVELDNISLKSMDEESAIKLGNGITVQPFLVPHRDEFTETVGYKITKGQQSLIYIPDIDKWSNWSQDLKEVIEQNTYVLIDGTFYDATELPGRDMSQIPHPFVVETMELLKDLPKEEKAKVYFIHLNHTNPLLDKNSKEYKEVLKQGFNIAKEGITLILND